MNKVNTIVALGETQGDVIAAAPGLKESILSGSFNDTQLDPIDSDKGVLTGSIVPVKEIMWNDTGRIDYNGAAINTFRQ